jgi:hypothetical protein
MQSGFNSSFEKLFKANSIAMFDALITPVRKASSRDRF